MKDNSSATINVDNRNWGLKRKRKKLRHGPEKSEGKQNNAERSESLGNASPNHMPKSESTSAGFSAKKKGDDGVIYLLV